MADAVEFKSDVVRRWLKDINDGVDSVKEHKPEYMAVLSAIVFKDIIGHFTDEEGSEGKWKDWSPGYQEYMNSIGRGNNRKLQFSGKLRNSFKPTNSRSTDEGILWYNNAKTSEGFPYAAAHDEGGGRLPQREFMWLSDDAVENIAEQTLAFILDKV